MSPFRSLSTVKLTFDKPLYTVSLDLRLTSLKSVDVPRAPYRASGLVQDNFSDPS